MLASLCNFTEHWYENHYLTNKQYFMVKLHDK